MRLYEGWGESAHWAWTTWETTASTGSITVLDLGELPSNVARVRVTAWWLEVNTGWGEIKADLAIYVVNGTGPLWGGAISATAETNTDRVLRIDLDRDDPSFGCPTGGHTWVVLQGIDVPTEARYPSRNYHDVYVAVFWESGRDESKISCPSSWSRRTPCDSPDRSLAPTVRLPSTPERGTLLLHALENGISTLASTVGSPRPVRANGRTGRTGC